MSFKKALEIIRDNQIHRPKQFACLMWPDSGGWQRVHKVDHGASRGTMMAFAGGGILGKLRLQRLIRDPWYDTPDSYYRLTGKGQQYLEQHSTEKDRL